jgi:branched-chain amino acid transport system ATP-binding protein
VETLLQAGGVSCGYNGHAVVRDADLEVRAGEVVGLLGANGAGKTTTLNTLAGYLPALAGTVTFGGRPAAASASARAREGLAFVPEGRSVFPKLTTRENLRVGRCDVERALALFPELRPLLGRKAGNLSGGEQQMLVVGRALARRPKVILADELSLGLAPKVVTRLLEALRAAAHDDGVGVMIVEQHVQQALRYADRVYVLRRGTVALSGTAAEVAPQLEDAYLSGAS